LGAPVVLKQKNTDSSLNKQVLMKDQQHYFNFQ
jgi:hypothetical protein